MQKKIKFKQKKSMKELYRLLEDKVKVGSVAAGTAVNTVKFWKGMDKDDKDNGVAYDIRTYGNSWKIEDLVENGKMVCRVKLYYTKLTGFELTTPIDLMDYDVKVEKEFELHAAAFEDCHCTDIESCPTFKKNDMRKKIAEFFEELNNCKAAGRLTEIRTMLQKKIDKLNTALSNAVTKGVDGKQVIRIEFIHGDESYQITDFGTTWKIDKLIVQKKDSDFPGGWNFQLKIDIKLYYSPTEGIKLVGSEKDLKMWCGSDFELTPNKEFIDPPSHWTRQKSVRLIRGNSLRDKRRMRRLAEAERRF